MWINITEKIFNSPTSCNFIALTGFIILWFHLWLYTNWNIPQLLVEPSKTWNTFSQGILQMSTAPRALMCACTHQHHLWNLDNRNTQKKQNKANNMTITTGLRPRCAKFLFSLLIVLFSPACALATVASCIPSPSITIQSHYSLPLPAKVQPLRVKCKAIRYRIQILL
jgi:ABC-type nickel/cobalt efflux system permease component RcnA